MAHTVGAVRAATLAVGVAAFVALAAPLDAQVSVRGVLLDSLRTIGPLDGAEVVLTPGGRRTSTDANGRFVFADVAPGSYRVTYAALWLDSVGVAPASAVFEVGQTQPRELVLATGARVGLARTRCGGEMDRDRGLVVGELRDARAAPVAGGIVVARWSELVVGAAAAAPQEYFAVDTTPADGRFALCGMREGAEVVVAARHPDGRRTDPIVLIVAPGVYPHDLVLGDVARVARISGRVTNAAGSAVPRADVLASSSTSGVVRSDSAGQFRLDVQQGSRQLVVRALGFQPRVLDIRVAADEVDLGPIALEAVEAVLDTVVIRAPAMTREQAEFEYRRRTAVGVFITEADLRMFPSVTPNAVVSLSPAWVRTFPAGPGDWGDIYFTRGTGFCKPRLFVNGLGWGGETPSNELRGLVQMAKRVELYRAAFAPAQFADFDGCGAIVVWLY